jgi:hypothetical protein
MTTPLLIHVDPSKPFVLETNASNFVVGVVFHNLEKTIFFILSVSVLVSFLLQRLIMIFMFKNF